MWYYTTHPNLGISALVEAPTTEKARTTFLDYLERQNLIGRADRQYWRKNMVAERMEDPRDVSADIELHYGYQDGGPQLPPSMMTPKPQKTYGLEEEVASEALDADWYTDAERVESPADAEPTRPSGQEVAKEAPRKLSPIQQLALGRLGQ